MSQSFKLYRLQKIDTALDQARLRLHEVEAALANNEQIRQARQLLEANEKALQEAQHLLKRAEDETQTQRNKRELTEAALYGGKVRNPKELQDLQNESASLRRLISTLEDHQLEAMLSVEEKEAALKDSQGNLSRVESEVATQQSQLRAEQARLRKEIEGLETERSASTAGIPAADIALYEQIRQQRRGVAVSQVVEESCSACGSSLYPALVQQALSSNQLARCSFCGRILYAGEPWQISSEA